MRPKLSYANVVASLALFLALGGAAYAATQLPQNSVGTKQIRNGTVTAADVKNQSLTGADVKNQSLTGSDLKPGALNECPAGTRRTVGVCFETSPREATGYGLALLDCAGEGKRLPSQGELTAYDSLAYTGSQTTQREWVEPSWIDAGVEKANYVVALNNGALGFGSSEANTNYQYRCVSGA
ncbi:MAG: hypothetical protein AB7T48_00730 [Solirubrobacterales bacterium]